MLYSHRSNVLHSLISAGLDCLPVGPSSTVMPVVPMFHANSWGLAFSCPMRGAKMVMPGARLDGASVYELLETEKVDDHRRGADGLADAARLSAEGRQEAHDAEDGGDRRLGLPAGDDPGLRGGLRRRGAPRLGHDRDEPARLDRLDQAACRRRDRTKKCFALKAKQGWAPFGVEMKIVDDENHELPWDGKSFGRLKVAGPAVAKSYFKGEGGDILDENGFFDTGDVATIDPNGYMQITDRAKDVIKSGGEWISSIDIENFAVGHPDVAEAAVIGVAHPKWDERPLLVVVPKEGKHPKAAEVLGFLEGRIAKWWMPDDMQMVKEIPHTATGKINKLKLREAFKDYKLPTGLRRRRRAALAPHCALRVARQARGSSFQTSWGAADAGICTLAEDFLLGRRGRRPRRGGADAVSAAVRLRHGSQGLQPGPGLSLRDGHGRVADVGLDGVADLGRPQAGRADGRAAADRRSGDRRHGAQRGARRAAWPMGFVSAGAGPADLGSPTGAERAVPRLLSRGRPPRPAAQDRRSRK